MTQKISTLFYLFFVILLMSFARFLRAFFFFLFNKFLDL
jgi:hypothetical protein